MPDDRLHHDYPTMQNASSPMRHVKPTPPVRYVEPSAPLPQFGSGADPQLLTQGDAALAWYQAEYRKLFEANGTPTYSEEVHRERESKLLAELDRRLNLLAETASGRAKTAQEAARTVQTDPTTHLTAGELAAANARAKFTAEDAQTLPLQALLDRCREALAASDRVSCFLLARYVGRRVNSIDLTTAPVVDVALVRAIKGLLPQMGETLVDKATLQKAQEVEAAAERARAMRDRVTYLRSVADGTDR